MHAHKHAWNDRAAATAQRADADAGSFARLFRSTQSITFSTSDARTSLYPLPDTPIPLEPQSPLHNIPQNSSRTTHLGRTWFYCSTLINKTECTILKKFRAARGRAARTMAPCVFVERLEGKQRCSRATVGEHAGIQAREWPRWLFTRNERSMKEDQTLQQHITQ